MGERSRARTIFGVGAVLVVCQACGSIPAPPAAPTAAQFDPKLVFRDLSKGASRPMVVDWNPDDRASLETHAVRGVVLVRFTETGIEPMWDCAIPEGGRYEYSGVSPKRDRVDAKSDAELAANFPMGFARLQSVVRSGEAITADVRMIGVAELNRLSVRRSDLPRACEKATHFVKELTIGGFVFGSAASRGANAGAGVGQIGAEVGYGGLSNRLTEEGDFKVCESADPESRTAPGRCKGILRIRLVPIDQDANQVTQTSCAGHMRWNGSACVEPAPQAAKQAGPLLTDASRAYECTRGDVNDCVAQCKNGNAPSCTFAGDAVRDKKLGSIDDLKTLYGQACKGNHWEGCSNFADILIYERKEVEATKLYGAACIGGYAGACTNYGVSSYFGRGGTKEDRGLAFKLWERACRLGDFVACSNAGVVVRKGEGGVSRNDGLARQLFEVSCKNGDPSGCSNLGSMFETGAGGKRDVNEALKLFASACEKNNAGACVNAGLLVEESAPADRTRVMQALSLYEKACDMESVGDGCASTAENQAIVGHLYSAEQIARRSCDGSTQSELGCYNAAFLYAAGRAGLKNDTKMAELARRACKSSGGQKSLCKNFK